MSIFWSVKSQEKTVSNLCTDFGFEHDLFLHCGLYGSLALPADVTFEIDFVKSRVLRKWEFGLYLLPKISKK